MVTMVLSGVFLAFAVSFARDEYLENERLKKKIAEMEEQKKEVEQAIKEVDSNG